MKWLGLLLAFGFVGHAQSAVHGRNLIASLCANEDKVAEKNCRTSAAPFSRLPYKEIVARVCPLTNSFFPLVPDGTDQDRSGGYARLLMSPASRFCWKKAGELFQLGNSCEEAFRKERFEIQKLSGSDRVAKVATLIENYQQCMQSSLANQGMPVKVQSVSDESPANP